MRLAVYAGVLMIEPHWMKSSKACQAVRERLRPSTRPHETHPGGSKTPEPEKPSVPAAGK